MKLWCIPLLAKFVMIIFVFIIFIVMLILILILVLVDKQDEILVLGLLVTCKCHLFKILVVNIQ